MREILQSIFRTSEERIKNPFIGTFIIAFVALNWKPISIFLLSTLPIEKRVNFITSNFNDLWNILWTPLIISIFYIGILPYLMLIFEKFTFVAFKNRNKNLYEVKKIDLDGRKDVAISEIELENLKSDYKEKSDLNNQIKNLSKELEIRDGKIENSNMENNNLRKEINDLKKILNESESRIQELRYSIKENENTFANYFDEYRNTPENITYEFVNSLHMLNRYLTDRSSLNNDVRILVERFINLGLIEYINDKTLKNRKFKISDKGLYFIKRAYQDGII